MRGEVFLISVVAVACHRQQAASEQAVFSRVFIVGSRSALEQDADARRAVHAYEDTPDVPNIVRVDERAPPPACGLVLRDIFLDETMGRFGAGGGSRCRGSARSVYCPTNLLERYKDVFLRLEYANETGKLMKLTVGSYYRRPTGAAEPNTEILTREDRRWLLLLDRRLRIAAECLATSVK